jgi:gamma-glutamyl:cysteine ligase YbdK (ATP-grasp superfamily)
MSLSFMKIGVEEEFLVVDPDTFFYTPGAIRLVNSLVYRDRTYGKKSNIELPLNSRMLKRPLTDIKKGFCVVEIKTDPYEDFDVLKRELDEHRKNLVDVAEKNNLMLLPTGVHPLFTVDNTLPDNCAALHIHVDNLSEKYYNRLLAMIPFLISLSANSPFYGGKLKAMSTRALISPHMNPPNNRYSRHSDLIINKSLNTIEIRVLDTQINSDDTLGLVEIVDAIAKNDIFDAVIPKEKYVQERNRAVQNGRGSVQISDEKYEVMRNSGRYAKSLLESPSGSEWQIEISNKNNLASVVMSLWTSFKKNKRSIERCSKEIIEDIKWRNLVYFIPYSPFFIIEKYKKFWQDRVDVDDCNSESNKVFAQD